MSTLLDFIKTRDDAFSSPTRLASLYSDFQYQRNSNPDGYAANSEAWLGALTAAAKAGKLPGQSNSFTIPTGEQLVHALQTPQYGRPLALQAVLEDAVKQGQMVPVADFISAQSSIYEKSWSISPWQLVDWALTKVGSPIKLHGGIHRSNPDLIVIKNLEDLADEIEAGVRESSTSNISRIYTRELFLSQFGSIVGNMSPSSMSFKALIIYLARDRKCLVYDDVNNTIKFRSADDRHVASITREDRDIASLRSLIDTLVKQVTTLENDIANLDAKIRQAVSSKNLSAAKRYLRVKKAHEQTLDQRSGTLDQLQGVYTKIEQAADQIEIIKVMQTAGRTLKSLNSQAGDVEDIRTVMEDLQDRIADTDEISNVINDNASTIADEADIDEELLALEQDEYEKLAAQQAEATVKREHEQVEQVRQKLEGLSIPPDTAETQSSAKQREENSKQPAGLTT